MYVVNFDDAIRTMDYLFKELGFDDEGFNFKKTNETPACCRNLKSLEYNEEEKCAVIELLVAGYNKENVSVDFENDTLIVKAKKEENSSKFSRRDLVYRYSVPMSRFNYKDTKAVIKNGILTVKVPVKEEVTQKVDIKLLE